MATAEKLDRNNQPVNVKRKKLRSNVEDFKDIKWERDTGNPYVDNAIEHDGFSISITINGKEYDLKSPRYKLIKKFKRYAYKEEKEGLSTLEEFEMDDIQEDLVEGVINGFSLEDADDMSDEEYTWLASLCWRYFAYSKKKSRDLKKDYT